MATAVAAIATSIKEMQASCQAKLGYVLPLTELLDLQLKIVRNFGEGEFWEELEFQFEEIANRG